MENLRTDDIIKFKFQDKTINGVILEITDKVIIKGLDERSYQCNKEDVIELLGRELHRTNKEVYEEKGYSRPTYENSKKWKEYIENRNENEK